MQDVYKKFRSILEPYKDKLTVDQEGPEGLVLYSDKKDKKGRNIFFGGVAIKKNYVSYYLMPVYCFPEMLKDISPELRKRMQGKSCFNFKKTDEQLFQELAELTQRGFERFEAMTKPPY